jgi:hypothetical protein
MKIKKIHSLFLCRTPLQARICIEIIRENKISEFDVIYFTQNDSKSDKLYFSQLSEKARNSNYIYIKKQYKDILNHLFSIIELKKRGLAHNYKYIYIASIDCFLFRFVVKKNPKASLLGFDDGSANITSGSLYYNLDKYKKSEFYAKILGLPKANKVKLKLIKHYSIYPSFENIISQDKIHYINLFTQNSKNILSDSSTSTTYFIGQPFHEYLDTKQIKLLQSWLGNQVIDYYILHPREKNQLICEIPVLETHGLLAEDAIFKISHDSKIRIISAYSTVLFNINCQNAEKIYLSLSNDRNEIERRSLIEKTGSKIITLI